MMTSKSHQSPATAASPLDVIFDRVNALGGYGNPSDPAAVAWAKEHAAVLDLIEAYRALDASNRQQVAA